MLHINNFRGFAILLIILTHTIEMFAQKSPEMREFDYIIGNGTYYFIFISGFIFFRSTENFQFTNYMAGKMKYVLLPYTLFSVPALLLWYAGINDYMLIASAPWFETLPLIGQAAALYLTGTQLGPYWFIPTIMIIYAVSPAALALKDRSVLTVLGCFLLFFVFAVLIARGNPVRSAIYFIPAFLLGFAVSKMEKAPSFTISRRAIWATIAATAALAAATPFAISFEGTTAALFNQIYCAVTTLALYVVFKKKMSQHNVTLDLFARLSFYIYFAHGFFLLGFRKLCENVETVGYQLVTIIATFAATLVLCILSYALLKWGLGKKSRPLIGA
ncbi:MAG: acyltransferase [Henriciella sp.]|uniref:acyltransferase family protein n=1 Tax=Henriciella sp. TaxID=1968823 RepID=UPI0032EAE86F